MLRANAVYRSLIWNAHHFCSAAYRLMDPLQTPIGKYGRIGNTVEKVREGGYERRNQSSELSYQEVQLSQRALEPACPHASQEPWP